MPKISLLALLFLSICSAQAAADGGYPVVDTGQEVCFDADSPTPCPARGEPFYGQDAQYLGSSPRYLDQGDGTVRDLVTGLTWVKARGEKLSWRDAKRGAAKCRVGGHGDWRMPSIKELYSLMNFSGWKRRDASSNIPFIDTDHFEFKYGDTSKGERDIDCQDWSATEYRGTTMNGAATVFGVNFADGRIKGYPRQDPRRGDKLMYVRYVRGNPAYGANDFKAERDTVPDRATGLVWQLADSGRTMNWQGALAYCENLELAGRSDWRLPSAKELQSIVDYARSPSSTGSAAIDPVFGISETESYFWTGTTHLDGPSAGKNAVYVAFGRAMGHMRVPGMDSRKYMDVHGAGAQRSDPKAGDPGDYPQGFGPQGDDRRIYNYARCVAGGAEPHEPPESALRELMRAGAGQDGATGPGTQGQRPEFQDQNEGERVNPRRPRRRRPPPGRHWP